MDMSIVMTYWNRKKQLFNTLRSIEQYGHEVEIIVIDDCSTDGEDIDCFSGDNVKIIHLTNKTWINPCIAFNTGLKEATGDIIILQNAECYHHGDIIGYSLNSVRPNRYLSFSAMSLNEQESNKLATCDDVDALIKPFLHRTIYVDNWDGNGWYNHPVYRPEGYHFCCAITRDDIYSLGGFDETYANGLGFDDNELLTRIKKRGMDIRIVERPMVIHQHHPKFQPGDVTSLMAINGLKWDITKASDSYDVKPTNTIYK